MATITIRGLDDGVRDRLRVRAAEHGQSMEAEAREILAAAVAAPPREEDEEYGWGSRIHARFAEIGGVDLELPPRTEQQREITLGE